MVRDMLDELPALVALGLALACLWVWLPVAHRVLQGNLW